MVLSCHLLLRKCPLGRQSLISSNFVQTGSQRKREAPIHHRDKATFALPGIHLGSPKEVELLCGPKMLQDWTLSSKPVLEKVNILNHPIYLGQPCGVSGIIMACSPPSSHLHVSILLYPPCYCSLKQHSKNHTGRFSYFFPSLVPKAHTLMGLVVFIGERTQFP